MNLFRITKSIIWVFIILGIFFYINYKDFKSFTLVENKNIIINEGDTLRGVLVNKLNYNKNYVKFYLYNNQDINFNLQKGNYTLIKGDNLESIIKTLKYGNKKEEIILTILPGWNIYDIDNYLQEKLFIKPGDFVNQAENVGKYKNDFGFLSQAITLEGYLYPDTYYENKSNFNLEKFIKRLLSTFDEKIYKKLLLNKNTKEINEIITLASILEKEEKVLEEKPIVAGILKKRLDEKWMIGADITACYNYKLTQYECKMNLSKYIYEKNDYNTRTMVGLPKTPINNPSYNTINATINYKVTPYYYYLHNSKTGEIYYGKTLEDHNYNKRFMN